MLLKTISSYSFSHFTKNRLKLDYIQICCFLHCWSRIVVYLGEEDFPGTGGCIVRIVTRLRTGRPGIVAEFPTGSRVTSPQNVQVCSGPHITFYSVVPWGLPMWVKWHWCVAEVLFTSFVTASVRYASIYDHDVHFIHGEGWDWCLMETDVWTVL